MADTIIGLTELQRFLFKLASDTPEVVAEALYREGLDIMKVAQSRTPVKTGALRDSGTVHKWDGNRQDIKINLTFGVPEPKYAIFVHENLEAKHPNGQAKFLESAVMDAIPGWGERLAKRIVDGWEL